MTSNAPLAQLDRVFGYEPKGRGFESLTACQKNFSDNVREVFYFFTKNSAIPLKTDIFSGIAFFIFSFNITEVICDAYLPLSSSFSRNSKNSQIASFDKIDRADIPKNKRVSFSISRQRKSKLGNLSREHNVSGEDTKSPTCISVFSSCSCFFKSSLASKIAS